MLKHLLFSILFAFLIGLQPTFAQLAKSDTSFLQKSVAHAVGLYEKGINAYAHLYNGSEYVDYDYNIQGHQYFESEDWEQGSVFYDGALYQDVSLQYDIVKDKLLVIHNDLAKIELIDSKIAYFKTLNHTFVRLESDTATGSTIRTGFYDLLYDGKVKAFAKRVKTINETIANQKVESEFMYKDAYFIRKGDRYYSVKSKKAVLNVFKDQKKDLQKFIRENKVDFRKGRESAIVLVSKRYDEAGN